MPVLTRADQLRVGASPRNAMYEGKDQAWPILKSFDPVSISGLMVWLDGSDAVIGTTWPDKSGTSHHGNVVGSPAPVVTPNVMNGKSVVRFTVSEGRIRRVGTGVLNNYTAIHITRTRGTIGRGLTAIYPGPYNSNCLMGTHSAGYDAFYDNGWINQDPWPTTRPTPWKLYTADSSIALNEERWFVDGIYKGMKTPSSGLGDTYAISGYDLDTSAETCDIDVAEVLIWDHRLTDTERQQVEAYLREKWALS